MLNLSRASATQYDQMMLSMASRWLRVEAEFAGLGRVLGPEPEVDQREGSIAALLVPPFAPFIHLAADLVHQQRYQRIELLARLLVRRGLPRWSGWSRPKEDVCISGSQTTDEGPYARYSINMVSIRSLPQRPALLAFGGPQYPCTAEGRSTG